MSTSAKNKSWIGLILILPSILILSLLKGYPLVLNVWLSLTNKYAFLEAYKFVYLSNYLSLFRNPLFWNSLRNSVIYTSSTVGLQLLVGMGSAVLLNQAFIGRSVVRSLFLVPYVIPTVVGAIVWKWMLNDLYGIINHLLMNWGIIHSPILITRSAWGAMTVVILLATWRFFPFVTLCVLARLQSIPQELYASAKVDGASAWKQFIYITLPHLKGILYVVIILRIMWMFNEFDIIYLVTGGGPLGSTETFPISIYRKAFKLFETGSGAAIGTISFLLLLVLYIVYSRIYKSSEA